jgi:hypothetical protein
MTEARQPTNTAHQEVHLPTNADISHIAEALETRVEIPTEIIQHFGVDPATMDGKQMTRMREIVEMLDGGSMEEKFISLIRVQNRLQSRLGRSDPQPLYERVWNWLKVNKVVRSNEARLFAMENM